MDWHFVLAYTRSRRRRRRRLMSTAQTTPTNGRESVTMRPDAPRGRTYRRRNAAYWGRRRERRKLRQAQERTAASIYDPYGNQPLPEPYSFEPEPYSNMLDEYPAMVDYEGYDWPHSVQGDFHSLYGPAFADQIERVPIPANVRYGRSRNDEYLAQARALIQAQNEHLNPGFRSSYESRHYPTSNSRGTSWDSRPQWSHSVDYNSGSLLFVCVAAIISQFRVGPCTFYKSIDEVIKVENLSPVKDRSKPRRSKRKAAAMVKPRVVAETGANRATRFHRPPSGRFASFAAGMEALRGARETAVVASQVAMNAAALVEQYQNYNDGQYGMAESTTSGKIGNDEPSSDRVRATFDCGIIFSVLWLTTHEALSYLCFLPDGHFVSVLSRTQKRRRQRLAAAAKSAAHFPTSKASRRRTTVYGTRRRVRHRLRRTPQQAAPINCQLDGGSPQSDLYPFEPEMCSNIPVAYPVMTDYEGYDCPIRFEGDIHPLYGPAVVNPVVCVPAPSNLCYSCLCYADYLARARAWIQARNEQLCLGFHFPFEPPYHTVSVPRSTNWSAPFQWNPS
ncbi:hypothetical protein AHF37_04246 [Paragonimus kellicotti]|nr:hypothetical protein AHF37_04246 [Paragonimus kellicotti]